MVARQQLRPSIRLGRKRPSDTLAATTHAGLVGYLKCHKRVPAAAALLLKRCVSHLTPGANGRTSELIHKQQDPSRRRTVTGDCVLSRLPLRWRRWLLYSSMWCWYALRSGRVTLVALGAEPLHLAPAALVRKSP